MANIFSNIFKVPGQDKKKKANVLAGGNLQQVERNTLPQTQPGVSYLPQSAQNIPSATPANQGATKPAPTPPPKAANPAQSAYVSNLMNTQSPQTPTTPISSTSTPTKPAQNKEQNAYIEYLKTAFNPQQLAASQKNIDALNKQIENETRRSQKREEELRANPQGQLATGQQYGLSENQRLSNQSLGNLGLALQGAQGQYERSLGLGKELYTSQLAEQQYADTRADKEYEKNAPFELSEGQSRYEYDPATGQYKQTASKGKTYAPSSSGLGSVGSVFGGTLSPLAQAVQNGTIELDKLTPTQRGQVAAELASSGIPSTRQQTLQSNLSVVNALLDNPNVKKISGYIQGKLGVGNLLPGAQLALNQYNQLKGILSLENREKLKSSGAISDFEFKVLSDAATALGRNLSDTEFQNQLRVIKDVFEGKYALTNALNNSATQTAGGSDPLGIR